MSNIEVASKGDIRLGPQGLPSARLAARSAVVAALSLCVAFTVGAIISLQLHFPNSLVYFIWLPSVMVFLALLLSPRKLWWVYLVALFPVHMLVEVWTVAAPPLSIIFFYLVIWVQALAGALVVEYLAPRPFRFHDLRALIAFLLGAAVAALVQALTLTIILVVSAPASNVALTFAQGFLEDSLAILVFAPALLLAGSAANHVWRSTQAADDASARFTAARSALIARMRATPRPRLVEASLLMLGLLAVGFVAFGGYLMLPSTLPALLYAVLPLLLWATVRFGLAGTSLALSGLTLLSIFFAIHERGPFSTGSVTDNLLSLQLFFVAVSVPLLVLAVIIQERQGAQVGLRQSEERYRAVVSNFPQGAVLLYGPDLRHLFADGQGLPQVGLSKAYVEGRTLWEAFPADMAAALEQPYRGALAGTSAGFDLVHRGRTYQTQVVPIRDTATPTGMVVMQDVTEQRRAELLAELDRAKTVFFSNVSHEFRTPLTLLLGPAADALADRAEPLPARQRQRLELIQRNGIRLHKLVNSLLDFARIEAGSVQASYALTDLAAFTSDLASTFRSAIERAGLDLVVWCEPRPQLAYVDRDMWEKIVLNLLSNALKFTFVGRITVTQVLRGDQIELQVRDTGTGIPATELPRVFERFHRVQQTRARTHEGTGIGLALVQELTRLHAGTVEVDSTVGQGSTFTVTIPSGTTQVRLEPTEEPSLAVPSLLGAQPFVEEARQWTRSAAEQADTLPRPDGQPMTRSAGTLREDGAPTSGRLTRDNAQAGSVLDLAAARILVVDDNADMRDYLARLLGESWQVETASTGASALARAQERPPDLVLADVMMPDLDGFAVLRALRDDPSTAGCPVVLLSARAGEEAIIEGLTAGADDYLVKPFAAGELVARVRTHLELTYLRRQAVLHARELEAIIQAMTEAVFVFNAVGGLVRTNVAGRTLLGVDGEEASDGPALDDDAHFLPLADPQGAVISGAHLPVQQLLGGEVLTAERALNVLVNGPDDQERTLHITGSPVRDALGIITAAVVVCRDITELKRTQDALERQERLFRTLVEHQPDMISRFDRNHRRIYTNAQVSALYGQATERLLGTTFHDLGLPDEVSAIWDAKLTDVFASGKPITYETDFPIPGDVRTVQVRLAPELAADGSVESVLSIASDTTERKQAEGDLRRAKEAAELARSEAEEAKRQEEQRRQEADRRRRVAETLRDVMAILNSQRSLDDVLDYIVQQAANVLGSQAAIIYRVPATPAGLAPLSTHGISLTAPMEAYLPIRSAAMRRIVQGRGAISYSDTAKLSETLSTSGMHEKPAPSPFVVPLDPSFRAVLAGPIVVGGEPYGGLALLYQDPRSFTPEECGLASMLCDQVAIAIENANLRVQAARVSALAERARLARELHDAVTQTLFTASLVASALPNVWDTDPAAGRQGLEDLRSLTRTALAEMRTLLVELRPTALTEKPLGDLLRQLSEAMRSRVQAPITVEVDPDAGRSLPSSVQIALYRVAQEAVNNIAKHAHAHHVLIQLQKRGERTVLRMRDDGAGFEVSRATPALVQTGTGTGGTQGTDTHPLRVVGATDSDELSGASGSGRSGIAIMRERARSIGASFSLRSHPRSGTVVIVRWPGWRDTADVEEERDLSVLAR